MKLSKNFIDIGVQTNQREAMLDFWGNEVALPYEELLKVGGGTHQHRHTLRGSVFKLNHLREPLSGDSPSGYVGLKIATPDLTEQKKLSDPDGNSVALVPEGQQGISHIGIDMEVSSLRKFQHFYRHILQIEEVSETCFKWGTTLFFLTENTRHQYCRDMRGTGFRYITVQVHKVDEEHSGVLARGGVEGRAPVTLGKTARISFILDPDGNWIEISQRASLTGDLS
jgi:catechol 2,3-dioxygenase-like lactoylglutathione lyase family enzyme